MSPLGIVNFVLSEGQRQDMKIFPILCKNFPWDKMKFVIADKGYSNSEVKNLIRSNHCEPVIPTKINRCFPGTYDKKLYRTRLKIENFFIHLKEYKRLALRFDKLDITFISFICCAIMLRTHLLC